MVDKKSFKDFMLVKEAVGASKGDDPNKGGKRDGQGEPKKENWRKELASTKLPKGFIPPPAMRPVIEAFLKSSKIIVHDDTTKPTTMAKKSVFLVGGPVRDFLKGKTINDFDLATNATPQQVGQILGGHGFKHVGPGKASDSSQTAMKYDTFQSELGLSGTKADHEARQIRGRDHSTHGGATRGGFEPLVRYVGEEKPKAMEVDWDDDSELRWKITGYDSSKEQKPFVITAIVGRGDNAELFEIATFRKDAKVTDGAAEVDFVDDPREDASRRDLTINAMYIELTKSNAENKTLFDPTGKGLADLGGPGEAWKVRTVGKAKDRFEEDPLRILRAIRFHCRGGSSQSPGALDKEIKEAIPNFLNMGNRLRGVDRIKGEFDKGLKHPDTDMKCYISTLKSTKLLNVLFPDVVFDPPNGIPVEFSSEKDRILQIAWILQHNPIEKVKEVLSVSRMAGGVGDNPLGPKQTGWESHDARAVVFLLRLKEFTPDQVGEMLRNQKGTGLSKGQIEKWVSMFDKVRSRTDIKTPHIKNVTKFANYESQATWPEVQEKGGDICPYCEHAPDSFECERCMSSRKLPKGMRGRAVHDLETEKFIAHK